MNLVDDAVTVDQPPTRSSRSPRRPWAFLTVAAATAAIVTGALFAGPGGEQTGTIVEPGGDPAPPTSLWPGETVTDPVPVGTPPAAPERLSESSSLRLDGVGPVLIGMTLEEASAAAGMPIRIIPGSDRPGTGACAHARAEGGPNGLQFMVVNSKIVRVEVGGGPIRTVSGIGTGNTEAEVEATYHGRISVQPNPYAGHRGVRDLVYVPDEGSRHLGLLFQTDGGRVTSFRSGLMGAVMAPEGCA